MYRVNRVTVVIYLAVGTVFWTRISYSDDSIVVTIADWFCRG